MNTREKQQSWFCYETYDLCSDVCSSSQLATVFFFLMVTWGYNFRHLKRIHLNGFQVRSNTCASFSACMFAVPFIEPHHSLHNEVTKAGLLSDPSLISTNLMRSLRVGVSQLNAFGSLYRKANASNNKRTNEHQESWFFCSKDAVSGQIIQEMLW